jgi:hypothetical protein
MARTKEKVITPQELLARVEKGVGAVAPNGKLRMFRFAFLTDKRGNVRAYAVRKDGTLSRRAAAYLGVESVGTWKEAAARVWSEAVAQADTARECRAG